MPDVSAPYFKYVLLAGRSDLCARGNGTTFTELSSRGLGSAPVPVPPLDEQRRIVEYLDTETARIDDLIAEQERVQQPLQVEWLKSELVHALLPERSPLGWSRTRLKYLFQSERNGIWGDEPQDGPDDVVCVRVADFDRTNFKAGASAATVRCVPAPKRLPRLLVPGDVLLEKSGGTPDRPVGCAVTYDGDGPAVCSNFVAALRPAPEVDARFAALLLAACYEARRNAPFVKQTTGIQNLDSGAYLGSACALPARSEQERVARHLDRMIDLVQRRQSELKRQVELLHEHRQALITAAVTGGLEAVGRVA
jgi:type I restriction enzyme S subunit